MTTPFPVPPHDPAAPEAPAPLLPPRRRGPSRWVKFGVVALLVVGGAWGGWVATHQAAAVAYETTPADRGTITAKVTASGTLSALNTVEVGSQVSGRLSEVLVDFNSPVKAGQVIARLEPQLLQAALEQARANDMSARANLERARTQAEQSQRQVARLTPLAKQGFVAASELDTAITDASVARAAVTVAQASVRQAAAQLHQAQINLTYTDIRSPINGVVISRAVDVGQSVAASLQSPVLFVLAENLKKVQVDTSVSEADVSRLKPGMAADFTVDAYPTVVFRGKVRQIRNAATTVQNVVTYDAVVDVDNPELKLKPGMTANVSFVEAEHEDALRVPNAALRFQPTFAPGEGGNRRRGAGAEAATGQAGNGSADGDRATGAGARPNGEARPGGGRGEGRTRRLDRKTVWVLKDGKPSPVRVRTGLTDGSYTEVAEVLRGELDEGAAVITDQTGGAADAPARRSGGNSGAKRMRRMF